MCFGTLVDIGRFTFPQIGPRYLDAAALANMTANLTGFTLCFGTVPIINPFLFLTYFRQLSGMCTAIDTLSSQAFGARFFHKVGLFAQRGALLLSLFTIPVAYIWLQTPFFLSYLGIDEETADLSGVYVRILILGMWPAFMAEVSRRYLQVCIFDRF